MDKGALLYICKLLFLLSLVFNIIFTNGLYIFKKFLGNSDLTDKSRGELNRNVPTKT